MRTRLLLILFAIVALAATARAATEAQRRDHLDWMLKNLPDAPAWREWQQKTGALPPDFDALPSANFLPDPFKFHDGRAVNMPADWPARREEIKQLYQKHILGLMPPKPKLDRIVPVSETKANGYVTRVVRLEYGSNITAQVTLTLPEGAGPFPVLIGGGSWSASLIRRGYAACEFPSSVDQPTNLQELHPGFDFATMAQRAWTVQLVVDYLLTVPEIDRARIAITGYSRGGKMATIAAAFDERIAAVIAGSTGVGGVLPWRLAGERVESTTRSFPLWFAPQLRFFSGREDRLPVDANLLVALVAPRAFLMNYGLNDEVSNVWANEQCYASALKVYSALGQPERLGVMRLPGFHGANDIEGNLDWLDIQFGRTRRIWRNDLLFPWDFAEWRKTIGDNIDLTMTPARSANGTLSPDATRAAIEWLLGPTPAKYVAPGGGRGFGGFPGRGPAPTAMKPVANPG